MTIHFSDTPGCRERHLQRKYNNPLFDGAAITQAQVDEAREQDRQEAQRFTQETYALLQEAAQMEGQVDTEVILGIKEQIDRLYQMGAGLGGDYSKEQAGLRRLNEIVMRAVRTAAQGDTLASSELDKEHAAYEIHINLLEYPVVSHLLREDTPVAEDELVPTLLCEDEDVIQVLMTLFDTRERVELCQQARQLCEQLAAEGNLPDYLEARIAAMEAPVQ